MIDLAHELGPIDIYLLDQLLRRRVAPGMRVLDAGCGPGRNLVYFLRAGYEVFGADSDAASIAALQDLAPRIAPGVPASNFRVEAVEMMSFPDAFADVVLSIAALHFARDDAHFERMLQGTWRTLKPGGLFFCRLASDIGMEARMRPRGGGRFQLPDGSERYLVSEAKLVRLTRELGGRLVDPLKTTVVQDQRCMTTWVVKRSTE